MINTYNDTGYLQDAYYRQERSHWTFQDHYLWSPLNSNGRTRHLQSNPHSVDIRIMFKSQ